METIVLKKAMKADKPILGICRGIQFINAALGGTLYQDIPTQFPSAVEHHQKPPYDRPIHEVVINKESPLFRILQKEKITVNSYHHCGICKLAPGLKCMASSTDELIEAVWAPGRTFLWAMQWHPEFSYKVNEDSKAIFAEFVRACRT